MAPAGPPIRSRGYSLIELLVVLAILAILAIFVVPNLGVKSPKAVRGALQDLKSALQQSRMIALSNGKSVDIKISTSGSVTTFQVYPQILKADGSVETSASTIETDANRLMGTTLGNEWGRYAAFTASDPPVSSETVAVKSLASLTTLGLDTMDWSSTIPTSGTKLLGFSSHGTPEFVDAATRVRTPIITGVWLGVVGLTRNEKGVPYGCVFITQTGLITGYYKPDSILDTTTYKWQRLE